MGRLGLEPRSPVTSRAAPEAARRGPSPVAVETRPPASGSDQPTITPRSRDESPHVQGLSGATLWARSSAQSLRTRPLESHLSEGFSDAPSPPSNVAHQLEARRGPRAQLRRVEPAGRGGGLAGTPKEATDSRLRGLRLARTRGVNSHATPPPEFVLGQARRSLHRKGDLRDRRKSALSRSCLRRLRQGSLLLRSFTLLQEKSVSLSKSFQLLRRIDDSGVAAEHGVGFMSCYRHAGALVHA